MSDQVRNDALPRTYLIDNQSSRDGMYDVLLDSDGDGVPDASPAGAMRLSETQLNTQVLKDLPFKASNGNFVTASGQQVSAVGASVLTDFSQPPLPDYGDAKSASPEQLAATLKWLDAGAEITDASLMWQALMTLATSNISDIKLARQIRNHFQKQKMEWKDEEIDNSRYRIANEKRSAWLSFGFNVGGVLVGATFGLGGTWAGSNPTLKACYKNGWSAASATAYSVPYAITALGTAMDKQWGFQANAYEAQIDEKEAQKLQEAADQVVEDTRSNEEEAREGFRQAKKLIEDHNDRQLEINRKITSLF